MVSTDLAVHASPIQSKRIDINPASWMFMDTMRVQEESLSMALQISKQAIC
jgi:hypothetical protein